MPSAITAMKDAEKRLKSMPKSPTSVEARYSFYDARRIATAVAVSASGRSAALTDNFGRVILLDCASGLVVRMWKGYRSAEVAWMTLVDNRAKSPSQKPKYVCRPHFCNFCHLTFNMKILFNIFFLIFSPGCLSNVSSSTHHVAICLKCGQRRQAGVW